MAKNKNKTIVTPVVEAPKVEPKVKTQKIKEVVQIDYKTKYEEAISEKNLLTTEVFEKTETIDSLSVTTSKLFSAIAKIEDLVYKFKEKNLFAKIFSMYTLIKEIIKIINDSFNELDGSV